MKALLINPKSPTEFLFISNLLKKLDIKTKVLNEDEIEDLALGQAIEDGMKTENVSKSAIEKALKR